MLKKGRRVVITGIGSLSPVGLTLEETWKNLTEGTSGISKVNYEDFGKKLNEEVSVRIAGKVKGFDIENYFPGRTKFFTQNMDKFTLFGMVASKLALEDAGLIQPIQKQELDLARFCTIIGTGVGGIGTTSGDVLKLSNSGSRRVGVRSIIRLMPNALSGQVAIEWGLKGTAKDVTTACASGLDSLIDAYHSIKFGLYDYSLAGGSEAPLVPFSIIAFSNMRALSTRQVSPERASAPFSKERDGFVISEGATVFVLEELEHAKARKSTIYAEIGGGGFYLRCFSYYCSS